MSVLNRRQLVKCVGCTIASKPLVAAGSGLATAAEADDDPASASEEDGAEERTIPLLPETDTTEHWAGFRSNPGNTASVEDGPDFDSSALGPVWEYEYDSEESGQLSGYSIADDTVYLVADGTVHALEADTGSVTWSSASIGAAGAPTIAYETVYIGGETLVALDSTDGTIRWQADETAVGTPTVAYETVYTVADGTVYAFDADDGELRWSREEVSVHRPHDEDGDEGESRSVQQFKEAAVAVADGTVYAITDATQYGAVVALDPLTGELRETYTHNYGSQQRVAATRSYVFTEFDLERAHVIDTETETTIETSCVQPLAATDELLVTVSPHELIATDLETGEDRWRFGPFSHTIGPATIVDDTVYACVGDEGPQRDTDTVLVALDASDGSPEWTYSLTEFPIDRGEPGSEVIVSGDTIYLTIQDRKLVALREVDAEPDRDEEPEADEHDEESEPEGNESAENDESELADENGSADEPETESRDGDDETTEGDETSDDVSEETAREETETTDDTDAAAADGDDTAEGDLETDEDSEPGNGSDESESDDSEADSVPGFTTGAGLIGGGITLEWLRRRLATDEPDE